MSPGERAAHGRREPARPQYATTAPGFPPPYYQSYGVPHSAWLGAPLISMAGRGPQPARSTPVSKLAMQAQGAPLIIQNRRKFMNAPEQRNNRPNAPTELTTRCEPPEGNRPRNQQQARAIRGGRNNNTDAVSVASDESSGSTNSETMLPRIIKPRKRRKKDRKPNNITHDLSSSLDLGEVDHCAVSGITPASHGIYEDVYCREMALPYRLDVKVMEYPDHVPESYRVSALGEALETTRFGVAEASSPKESAVSSCQCRLCDPVGQIWDAHSIADLLDENSCGDFAPTKLEDSMKVVGPMGRRGPDTTLRRSWSDPSSRAPERREASSGDTYSAPNLYSLFPPARRASSPEPRSPLALEISSEIVTSMNGQRDLEIKLFSTSPPAISERRSFFVDKSESAVNKCIITNYDRQVHSAVNNNNKDEFCKNTDDIKSDVSDAGCSAFGAGNPSRNLCDLALVTV